MAGLELRDLAALPLDERAALAREVAPLQTLADVVAWCSRRNPPAAITDVVVQDEFTHDVVVALPALPGRLTLVFDTT